MGAPRQDRSLLSDSGWFWIAVFLTMALVVSWGIGPKYCQRQPQIERQFAARQRAGQLASGQRGPVEPSTPQQLIVRLGPLHWLLAAATLVAWSGLVWERRRRRGGQR